MPASASPRLSRRRWLAAASLAGLFQSLLADRFQLRIHWETKEVPMYRLIVDRRGSKLKDSNPGARSNQPVGTVVHSGMISGRQTEMSTLIYFLSVQLGRPITDETGLTGKYDFTLKWDPDGPDLPDDGGVPLAPREASIFSAVQEQLGLRLKGAKGPLKVLVIDGVARPPAN
jgi:uncharacterized protein (TIGR03435 family)